MRLPLSLKAGDQEQGRKDDSTQLESVNPPSVCLFVLSRFAMDRLTPTHLGLGVSYTWSTDSDVNLFCRHPHRHTQK